MKREKVAASMMRCPLCNDLLNDPTTDSLCLLHTFCRKCIYERLSNRGLNGCPVCEINLGCVSADKHRLALNLPDIRGNTFPLKRRKLKALELSPSAKTTKRSISSLVSTPIVSKQLDPGLPSATEKFATTGEIVAIEWHKCSAIKKRKLEEADYHQGWYLGIHDQFTGVFNKHKLDMACRWVLKAIPSELSEELMKNPLPEIFKCIVYHFANFFAYNRASVSQRFGEIELYNPVDKEDAHMKTCAEFEEKLANWMSVHDAKLKEQADFYEAKLNEQEQQYEAKIKFLVNDVVEKTNELFDRNKKLEHLLGVIEKKDHSIEMLTQRAEDSGANFQETKSLLEEQVKLIPKVQEESHRAGVEEGVKRVVRAIQAASPYVNWDRIQIPEDTIDEDRKALHRAFAEAIITASPPVTWTEDHGHVIIL